MAMEYIDNEAKIDDTSACTISSPPFVISPDLKKSPISGSQPVTKCKLNYCDIEASDHELISIKGNGLSIAFDNQKKAMTNSSCLIRGGKSESGSCHGVPAQKKRFVLPLGNVWLTPIRISGQFL